MAMRLILRSDSIESWVADTNYRDDLGKRGCRGVCFETSWRAAAPRPCV